MSMTTEKMHCIKGPGCFLGDFPAVRRRNAEVPAENGHPAALVNSKDDGMSDVASNATVPPQPRAQGSYSGKGRKTETDEGIMGSLKNAVPQDGGLGRDEYFEELDDNYNGDYNNNDDYNNDDYNNDDCSDDGSDVYSSEDESCHLAVAPAPAAVVKAEAGESFVGSQNEGPAPSVDATAESYQSSPQRSELTELRRDERLDSSVSELADSRLDSRLDSSVSSAYISEGGMTTPHSSFGSCSDGGLGAGGLAPQTAGE